MSGAAGLSAARRRRAGGGGNTQSTDSQPKNTQQKTATPQQITPMQVLNRHENRLNKICEVYEALNESVKSVENNSKQNNSSEVSSLITRVTNLEKNYQSSNTGEDISFFKNKTLALEEQVADLKRLLLKVQSFAMETNLSVMKKKKSDDTSEENSTE